MVNISDEILKEGANVTLGFIACLIFHLYYQTVSRISAIQLHGSKPGKGKKEPWNRYTDPIMLSVDRALGNLVEWQGAFLALLWLNALICQKEIWIGWLYVAARACVPVLARVSLQEPGIGKRLMFVSTVLCWSVLARFAYNITSTLYQ
jgi:hypothetical protein